MISASQLGRIAACPGSEHLPHVERTSDAGTLGTVIHKFLEDCCNAGMAEALAAVPAEHQEACALLGLESLPVSQRDGRWAAEVALAFNVETFAARELGRGKARDYSSAGKADLPGTADVIGIAESAVVVIDYKSGHSYQEADSWQMRFLGMAAALAYGKESAVCVTLLVRPGEEPVHLRYDMDAFAIAQTATDVAALVKRVGLASHDFSIGDHCRWCPAFAYCPVQTANIRLLASDTGELTPTDMAAQLTPEGARGAWAKIKAAKVAIERIDEAVRLYAERQPIDIGGGKWLGLKAKTTESLDGGVVRAVLTRQYGLETADAAVKLSATKTALDDALKPIALAKGIPLSKIKAEALAAIGAAGGVKTRESASVVEYKA
jgi:RecB family exonuclease